MNRIWNIALNDLRRIFRERDFMVFTLFVPAMMVIVVAAANGAFSGGGGSVTQLIDLTDNDNSAFSRQLIDNMRATNPNLVICPQDNNDANICRLEEGVTAEERLTEEITLALIEIPAGFETAVRSGEGATIVYRSNDDPNQTSYLQQTVQAAVQRLSGATVAEQMAKDVQALGVEDENFVQRVYDNASEIWAENPISVTYVETAQVEDSRSRPGFKQSVPGMGSMFVMFTVMSGAAALLLERKDWTLQRLFTMPVTKGQIIGGKMLGRFILGMIQFAIVFAIGLGFGTNFGNAPLGLVLVMAAFVACISALTLLLATLVRREEQASGLVTFMALTLAPLSGAWWPMEIMPTAMQQIAQISPITWAMRGFNEIIFFGGGVGDILLPVAVLLVMTVALYAVAVSRFKYE